MRPFYSSEQNHFSNFDKRASGKHLCDFMLKLDQWFRRRCALNKLLTTDDGRLTTDAGHRVITIAHLEHLMPIVQDGDVRFPYKTCTGIFLSHRYLSNSGHLSKRDKN